MFGLLHSLMASPGCKKYMETLMGGGAKYYRLLYSSFALLSLAALVMWQFSISSFYLASFPILKYVIMLTLGVPGLVLMIICIRKYFFQFSGVKVFFEIKNEAKLETTGVYAIVRHPLYLGTLAVLWSIFFYFPLLSNLVACVSITVYTLIGIRLEEQKLLKAFGGQYVAYRCRTPMLVPNFLLR
jgi:protein-S-isoprenylcysteine O-methyltransferase Ste14